MDVGKSVALRMIWHKFANNSVVIFLMLKE